MRYICFTRVREDSWVYENGIREGHTYPLRGNMVELWGGRSIPVNIHVPRGPTRDFLILNNLDIPIEELL